MKIKETCLNCQKIFMVFPSQYKQKFCSMKCRRLFEKKQRINKKCLQCGKKFIVPPSQKNCKFCSRLCHFKHMIKYPKIQKRCIICGKLTFNDKYCSLDCKYKDKDLYKRIIKTRQKTYKENPEIWNRTKKKLKKIFENPKLRQEISENLQGHIVTLETRNKISKKLKGRKLTPEQLKNHFKFLVGHTVSQEIRDKISVGRKGIPQTDEAKQKMSIAKTGVSWGHHTKKTRERMSKVATEQIINGERYFVCGDFYSHKNKKIIHYRSSYELAYYEILEKLSKVKKYEVEPFSIKYKYEGIIHRYIPDILMYYMDGTRELIEIKPLSILMTDKKVKCKIRAGKKYGKKNNVPFTVITEKELFNKNGIN